MALGAGIKPQVAGEGVRRGKSTGEGEEGEEAPAGWTVALDLEERRKKDVLVSPPASLAGVSVQMFVWIFQALHFPRMVARVQSERMKMA